MNDEDIKGVKPILHEWPTAHGLIRIVRVPGATWPSCETLDVDAGQWRACHPMEFMLTEEIVDLKKEIAVLRDGIDDWHQAADDRAREIIQQAAEIAALREKNETLKLRISDHFEPEIEAFLSDADKYDAEIAALRAWYDCLDCGTHVKVDEDGCCATCGRDADFIDLDYVQRRMTTIERVNEELRCEVSELRASAKRLLGWSEDSAE